MDRLAQQRHGSNGEARYIPPDTLPFRNAPNNLEAEQALLGAILVNNSALHRVADVVQPTHFYDPLHQQIYEASQVLILSGQLAAPITLRAYFDKAEPIDADTNVPQYLVRLARDAATIINARDYANTIRDLAERRQLIIIGEDIARTAYDSPVDFDTRQQLAEAQTRLRSLESSTPSMLKPVTLEELAAADLTPQAFVLTDLLSEQGLMMV